MKHFISIADCTAEQVRHLLDVSATLKKQYKTTGKNDPLLAGKTLAMVFESHYAHARELRGCDDASGGNGRCCGDEEVGLWQSASRCRTSPAC